MERTTGRADRGQDRGEMAVGRGSAGVRQPAGPSASVRAAAAAGTVRRTAWTGAVAGIALMGAVDEIVFHQLLQWHHFYVHTTAYWQIFSDGLFHLFTTSMFFAAVMLLWAQRGRLAQVVGSRPFWSGLLVGAGAFQLFDGTVNHMLLGIHPVRVGAETLWPYDLAWNAFAVLVLLVGLALSRPRSERGLLVR